MKRFYIIMCLTLLVTFGAWAQVPQRNTKAYSYYEKAITGDAEAQTRLGNEFYHSKDFENAVYWFRKAAEQGNATAQNNLGICYEDGEGVTKDISEAVKWYRKAAAQGNIASKSMLKRLGYSENSSGSTGLQASSRGKNSSPNDKIPPKGTEAYGYYKQAILGKAKAQNKLGVCYEEGEGGVTKDSSEAVKWYRKAAEQGYAEAEYNLGRNFRGTERVKWYRKAAEQGHAEAQDRLGLCYESGEGVTKSLTEAFKWHRKAAEQGHAWAQYELGKCYEKGKGVNKNINEAVKWYRKSAENGNTFALEILVNLGYSE